MRECRSCKVSKPLTDFGSCPKCREGRRTRCRECEAPLRAAYEAANPDKFKGYMAKRTITMHGITVEEYHEMVASQGGRCAICGTTEAGGGTRWHIDHDRRHCPTNKHCKACLRGLLCSNCNRGIGHLQDDPDVIEAAARYLRNHDIQP